MSETWNSIARYIEEELDGYVDWSEKFFVCPNCGEPVYESDWLTHSPWECCPICNYNFVEDTYLQ